MGRGVENGILSQILIDAKNNGIEEIRASFLPILPNPIIPKCLPLISLPVSPAKMLAFICLSM